MKYRKDKYGNEISTLAFGCMRFARKAGRIDLDMAEEQVRHAIDEGINYFDTAYMYPGNEAALGEVFQRIGCRQDVYIATKLPHYMIKNLDAVEKTFNEELRRLKTDYIDYYLIHMLTDTAAWQRLVDLGFLQWVAEKKASGQIRQLGFSYHGGTQSFIELIDAHDWDFTMIQYNYMDVSSQAGVVGLRYAHSKGIPVMIMEPLRGGSLADKLPAKCAEVFRNLGPEHTPVQWAFRWLWNQPEITTVLSGMNSMEMLKDNIATACDSDVDMLTDEQLDMFDQVADVIRSMTKVGCTGCGYCIPCPAGVDIPGTFACYNTYYKDGWKTAFMEYVKCTAMRRESTAASKCIGCGKCEKHCPQEIHIREELAAASKKLEGLPYKAARKLIPIFTKY